MDANLKAKWLEALRSGRYAQGRSRLKTETANEPTKYCCMGVLEKIAGLESEIPLYLCSRALQAVGISDIQQNNLTRMNDGDKGARPLDFPQIANYIEAHL